MFLINRFVCKSVRYAFLSSLYYSIVLFYQRKIIIRLSDPVGEPRDKPDPDPDQSNKKNLDPDPG